MPKTLAPNEDVKRAFEGDAGEELFRDTWHNRGVYAPTGQQFSMNDMLATSNASQWMPKIVEEIVRESIEPLMIIPSLLDRIQDPNATRYTFAAIGAMVAADIAEGMEYPERTLNIAPGSVTVNVGKSGIAVKITEEMRRNSQFDVVNLHLRAARRALDRHKEFKGMAYINSMGTRLFDNLSPTTSVFGTCTGRSVVGAGNGSCRMEDLLKAYAFLMMQGYTPDTLLLHPLTWSMWMTDPLLQTIVKNTGNGRWFQAATMPNTALAWAKAGQNKIGVAGGIAYTPSGNAATETPTTLESLDQTMKSAPAVPSYFPFPLTVLVSPMVPFDLNNNTADIMLCDSKNLGALIEAEGVTMDEWTDPARDITKIKLRERYAFAVYEDGLAIGVFKNVPMKANEIAFPVQPTISASAAFSELDVTTAISL